MDPAKPFFRIENTNQGDVVLLQFGKDWSLNMPKEVAEKIISYEQRESALMAEVARLKDENETLLREIARRS